MTNLQARKIEELRGGFKGTILLPSDDAYENARKIWNAMIDKRPAVIVRCATTSDVVRGVNFARDNGLLQTKRRKAKSRSNRFRLAMTLPASF